MFGCSSSQTEFRIGSSLYPDYLCLHLSNAWFPSHPELLKSIKEKLKNNAYHRDVSLLVEDIRTDFSLFAYCVRELAFLVSRGGADDESGLDPLKILRKAEFSQLEQILAAEADSISKHSWATLGELEGHRLMQAMLSAVTAEALSAGQALDPDMAFSCALFRQLGLTLMACNYPHIYARALTRNETPEALDQWLGNVLGVRPSRLGLMLARKWGLSKTLRRGLGERLDAESTAVQTVGEKLEKLCEIGEALARVSDPSCRTALNDDWSKARRGITETLGPHGLQVIFQHIEKRCLLYKEHYPRLFEQPVCAEVDLLLREAYGRSRFERNIYLPRCPAFLQERLADLYQKLDGCSINSQAVQDLIRHCAWEVGFIRGCVFLLEPETGNLEPRLLMGDSERCIYRPTRRSIESQLEDPVVKAYNSEAVLMAGGATVYLAGALGSLERIGVLYLEIPKAVVEARGVSVIDCFCAINQALSDCLHVQ